MDLGRIVRRGRWLWGGMTAGLLVAACQSVTGLDGLVFDRDEGVGGQGGGATASSGSMGQGASGQSSTGQGGAGQGGSGQGGNGQGGNGQGGNGQGGNGGNGQGGSGGAPPMCTPPAAIPCSGGLAVAPKIIGTAPAGNVAIASSAGVFGVYSLTSFFTLNGNGQIQSALAGPYTPVFRPRIAANNGGFAIAREYKPAGTNILGIVRFSLCGQETSAIPYDSPPTPTHADLFGGSGGFLVTILPYTGMFTSVHASWLPDIGTPTAMDFLGNVGCCTYQAWTTGLHGGSFQVASYSSAGETRLTPVGKDGNVGSSQILIPPIGYQPVFVGSVNSELVVASAAHVMRIGQNAAVLSDSPISDQAGCAFATSGTELLRACRSMDSKIMLTRVNTSTGAETPLHTLVVSAASSFSPAMAWDGAGYGIVWAESGGLAFARVCGP